MATLIGRGANVGFLPYGERLKRSRRLIHETLNPRHLARWNVLIEDETYKLVGRLLKAALIPVNVNDQIKRCKKIEQDQRRDPDFTCRFVGSLIVRFTYGQHIDEHYLHLVEKVGEYSSMIMIPGKWVVDSYPIRACLC